MKGVDSFESTPFFVKVFISTSLLESYFVF